MRADMLENINNMTIMDDFIGCMRFLKFTVSIR